MTNPLIVFRIGYMPDYAGPGKIVHGGNWIEQNGSGGEMWNFRSEAGRVYGFVMTKKEGGLNLNRISQSPELHRRGDELDGVDIVFISRRPGFGQVIVGWYRNAKVFHKQYWKRPNPKHNERNKVNAEIAYLCEANMENVRLLPEQKRTVRVPFAPAEGYGPGQANIWYGDDSDKRSKALISKLRKYIGAKGEDTQTGKPNGVRTGWGKPLSKQKILAIEKASMDATEKHFERHYLTEIIARDNRGWDITAFHKKTGLTLHLEVKGHLGNVIQFELTPNEYSKMREMNGTYRICVVRNALNNDFVEVYEPRELPDGIWELYDRKTKVKILLSERTGARASQVS